MKLCLGETVADGNNTDGGYEKNWLMTDGKKKKSQREREKREETMLSFVQVYCFWFIFP
jgi:hypothetical protein